MGKGAGVVAAALAVATALAMAGCMGSDTTPASQPMAAPQSTGHFDPAAGALAYYRNARAESAQRYGDHMLSDGDGSPEERAAWDFQRAVDAMVSSPDPEEAALEIAKAQYLAGTITDESLGASGAGELANWLSFHADE